MAKRKSTGKRQRFNIFKRDSFTCQYCGRTPPNIVLVLDHIIPVAGGGGNEDSNLITSCEACNQGKADGLLSSIPQSIESSLKDQIERREQLEEYNQWLMDARQREQKAIRTLGGYWCDSMKPDSEAGKWIPSNPRLATIKTFAGRLPHVKILEAMDIAISKKWTGRGSDETAWKYFCGVCWTMIRQAEGGE